MIRAEMYFKKCDGDESLGEMRISITDRWGQVLADMSYEEFLKKKGHSEIRLYNRINLADAA